MVLTKLIMNDFFKCQQLRLHEWSLIVQLHIAYDKVNIQFFFSLFEKWMYMIKVLKTRYYIKLIDCYCHRQNMQQSHLSKSKGNNINHMNDDLRENNVNDKDESFVPKQVQIWDVRMC